jgi:hypothetical protein
LLLVILTASLAKAFGKTERNLWPPVIKDFRGRHTARSVAAHSRHQAEGIVTLSK